MTKARNTAKKTGTPAAKTRTPVPKAAIAAAAPVAPAPKERTKVDVDHAAAISRRVAGVDEAAIPKNDGPKVEVDVPKAFILTDDGHEQHQYKPGRQHMLKAHADHDYAKANGVTKVK